MRRTLLLLALTMYGCSVQPATVPPGGETVRRPGIIAHYGASEGIVEVSDPILAGRPFTVTVYTYGGGCEEPGEMEAEVEGRVAVLRPYDLSYVPGEGEGCTDILKRLRHTTRIFFEQPGVHTLQVEGRRVDAETPPPGTPATVEVEIVVE